MPAAFRIVILTAFVLIAFAGNSVLARLALSQGDIGAWTFSSIRFVSGAAVLLCLSGLLKGWVAGKWWAALALLLYGVFFSYAYLMLPTGTGALLLFASVQLTMLVMAFSRGERLSLIQSIGLVLALAGLTWLLLPGSGAPAPLGAVLMIASGVGWGIYSILGKASGDPIAKTTGNFARAAIILIAFSPVVFLTMPEQIPTTFGIGLAVMSGVVTSGLGYALWYRVLPDLTVSIAAISQLSVPVIAAIGGVIFVSEPLTLPFTLACGVVLLGVGLATIQKQYS